MGIFKSKGSNKMFINCCIYYIYIINDKQGATLMTNLLLSLRQVCHL
jgi:hypothetical protein